MRVDIGAAVTLLLFFGVLEFGGGSPPGQPALVGCRSPEKETFTCWWSPGADGGSLPTTHRLFYHKENLDGTFECPDYRTAGDNSCLFGRSHTSIWLSYWVWVVASNVLGNTTSETLEVDVVDIVEPSPPQNVTVLIKFLEGNPYLHVKWQPPPDTDIGSGWVTLTYQLRVKTAGEDKWEEYMSGKQPHFNIHSLHSGEEYLVQVRCRLDHGHWSTWSPPTHIQLPNYALKQRLFWTLISVVSILLITTVMLILIVKRKKVKGWLLPPIPGPKIWGFDSQPFQSRYSEQILNGPMIPHGFLPTLAYIDHPEEYLVVSEGEDVHKVNHIIDNNNSKRSSIDPGVHRGSSLPCCERGPAQGLPHGPEAVEREASPGAVVTASGSSPPIGEDLSEKSSEVSAEGGPAKPHDPLPSGTWNTVLLGSFNDTGYVVGAEGPGKEGVQVADGKQDYSRVSGVNNDYGLPNLMQ